VIELRVASTEDGGPVAAIYAPIVRETAISFEEQPPSPGEMARRIGATLPRLPWLVATRNGQVSGYVYASTHKDRPAYRWSVDVTVYIAAEARGSGIGTRLYGALIQILKAQGFHSAFAGIALPNPGSVRLHESVGFRPLGVYEQVGFKLGRWHSVGYWRLGLSDGAAPPAEPILFQQIVGSDAVREILGAPTAG
jgi:L-amino acid N-acyltransferase YncA